MNGSAQNLSSIYVDVDDSVCTKISELETPQAEAEDDNAEKLF